jgi:spore germination protein YaaH
MFIPSIIVLGTRMDFTQIKGAFTVSKHTQLSSELRRKVLDPSQKSPLEIGWILGSGVTMQHMADYKNLKVVSPALATIDNQYNLQVNSDPSITNTIRQQGKRIWVRIIMQSDSKSSIHAFLANPYKTQGVINKVLQSAASNNWDGVNLDIENVSEQDRNAFSQFIKNLSKALNKTSLILSIDLPPDPKGSNNQQTSFDHELLGKYCNYIIFMGYDQHWSTDPIAGPVTSLSWLKENIQEFIQTGIPPEEIILGLPGYTRVWEQDQHGNIIKDPAQPIPYIENLVGQNHRNLTWDSTLGEYYTSYTVQNLQYKIWLPTEKSFNLYLELIPLYHLAGSAIWNLNQMNPDYWNKIF